MNRIVAKFAQLKSAGKKGLVVYIGAGDPNLAATRELALTFDQSGVDVLELGVPFSDPLADGLVNQLAAQRGGNLGQQGRNVVALVEDGDDDGKLRHGGAFQRNGGSARRRNPQFNAKRPDAPGGADLVIRSH